MARPSTVQRQPLSLTEELEMVEQQITLTLQEIDRNFSHAHRVVTSSILPIVEQYAVHSKHVWQGSQFWKQFFESSANVSLSGYEEDASLQTEQLDETTITTSTEDASLQTEHLDEATATIATPSTEAATTSHSRLETSESFSTPTAHALSTSSTTTFADYPSPYEALQDEVGTCTKQKQRQNVGNDAGPTTPLSVRQIITTPQSGSSPFLLPPAPTSIARQQKNDPLLCRVLDRNYRIQATPLTAHKYGSPAKSAHGVAYNTATTTPAPSRRAVHDPAFSSSPMAPPQLNEELFSAARKRPIVAASVVRPQQVSTSALTARQPPQFWDDSEEDHDDDDDSFGFDASPPKTMQFHVPQSRLLKTPAKDASRQIVHDILTSAGVGRDGEDDDVELDMDMTDYGDPPFEMEEASPSVVRKAVEDEIF
ncbi:hypothetical protein DV735_g520, partial [Chaetothyriales sp. CBS 134920]